MSVRPPLIRQLPASPSPASNGPGPAAIPPRYTGGYVAPARPVFPQPAASRPARTLAAGRHRSVAAVLPVLFAVTAVVLIGQVLWERWGSYVYADHRQEQLAAAFAAASAAFAGAPPTELATQASLALADGQMARLLIPDIGVDIVVVPGVGRAELRNGAGWDERTAFPGTPGNALISGHRTTYGAPFRELDELAVGSRIIVEVPGRPASVFEVRSARVIEPGDTWVRGPSSGVRLTLTTCHPEGDDRQRLVVQAELVEGEHAASALPVEQWSPSMPA